jgi:membrane protease YdiL (CAAX protease family)
MIKKLVNNKVLTLNFLMIFAFGMLTFFVAGYWSAPASIVKLAIRIILALFFLGISMTLRRINPQSENWKLFFAFFVASFAFVTASILDAPLQKLLQADANSISGIAKYKLVDAILIILPILVLPRLVGIPWKDLFMIRGRLGLSLLIGFAGFIVFAIIFYLQLKAQPQVFGQTANWLPWVLLFVLANSLMEELHFRALLLKPVGSILGKSMSNLCIALFFTLTHAPVQYTPDIFSFLIGLFFLSLAWGWLMQKTGTLWGSVLFHAGADLVIMAGIIQTYAGG